MTSQGVSALDEHRYIESFGGTRSYYELRDAIRAWYRENARLSPTATAEERLNPGNGWVSHLCFEPAVGVRALESLLRPFCDDGRLTVLLRHKASAAVVEGDLVRSVSFRHLDGAERVDVRASFVLDATELGDLLPLTGAEYVSGAESSVETGEPNARTTAAAWCVQSFTYPFALELSTQRPPVPEPEEYALNRERQPYTLRHFYHDARGWTRYGMFTKGDGVDLPFWTYRRLIDRANFEDPRYDVAMINWPGNDFRHGNIIDVDPSAALEALHGARRLALGFCRWLQTECPRDEGGAGYPEMVLRPEVMGTVDGLSKHPYIRESRRIRALRTIVEQDISATRQTGPRARFFPDSVGIGLYAIDIHPAEGEEKLPPDRAKPFQIPLSALVPMRLRNLLPACKNIGTTHITNGAYRLHPIEWNIGESAAHTAVLCMERGAAPQALAADPAAVRVLQQRLVRAGVPLFWYPDVGLEHPAFEASQVLAAWGHPVGRTDALEFGPDDEVDEAEAAALGEESGFRGTRQVLVSAAYRRLDTE